MNRIIQYSKNTAEEAAVEPKQKYADINMESKKIGMSSTVRDILLDSFLDSIFIQYGLETISGKTNSISDIFDKLNDIWSDLSKKLAGYGVVSKAHLAQLLILKLDYDALSENDKYTYDDISKVDLLSQSDKSKIQKNVNLRAVQNSIRNIFTWIKGERILNPEFGSNLRQYLYEGILDYNVEKIIAEIRNCFNSWEPRAQLIKVENVGTIDDTENNEVHLDIIYTIPTLSEEQYRYSFYYNTTD